MISSDPVSSDQATLEVVRDTPGDVQDRWVRLSLDDGPEEILRYGERYRRAIVPGPHRLKAHNTLSSDRIQFVAHPGQTVRVQCHNEIAKGGVLSMLTVGFAYIKVRLVIL